MRIAATVVQAIKKEQQRARDADKSAYLGIVYATVPQTPPLFMPAKFQLSKMERRLQLLV
jgi:hypothetical protein